MLPRLLPSRHIARRHPVADGPNILPDLLHNRAYERPDELADLSGSRLELTRPIASYPPKLVTAVPAVIDASLPNPFGEAVS